MANSGIFGAPRALRAGCTFCSYSRIEFTKMAGAFAVLCPIQMIIGLLMIVIGVIHRCALQIWYSFLMLPVWIGLLAVIAGFSGLYLGRHNKRQGYVNVNAVSAVRAVNMMCIGLSFLAFYMYGQELAFIGWEQEMYPEYSPYKPRVPWPPSRVHIGVDSMQVTMCMSVIVILSLLELFVGAWLALLEKDQMVLGSPPRHDRQAYGALDNAMLVNPNHYQQQYIATQPPVAMAMPYGMEHQGPQTHGQQGYDGSE